MDLKQIVYFETAYKKKSFSKASKDLLISQQNVSKMIGALENELGFLLFKRGPKGITPTEEGEYFHENAAKILKTYNQILDYFKDLKEFQSNELRIGLSYGLNHFFDETFFNIFRNLYPDVHLEVISLWNSEIEEKLQKNKIDLGITVDPLHQSGFEIKHIFREPLYCIVNKSHQLSGQNSVSFKDILDQKIIAVNDHFNSYRTFKKKCKIYGKDPKVIETSDLFYIYEQVLHNNYVGFTLESLIDRFSLENIKYLKLEDQDAYWDICFEYLSSTPKANIIKKFINFTMSQNFL